MRTGQSFENAKQNGHRCGELFPASLHKGDALLIVPPFHAVELAPFGVHLLQSIARAKGFAVNILFSNMLFARYIGEQRHYELCWNEGASTFCEAAFAYAANRVTPFADGLLSHEEQDSASSDDIRFTWKGDILSPNDVRNLGFDPCQLDAFQRDIALWTDDLVDVIASWQYDYIGVTCNFSQINASLAILRRIKDALPGVSTLIGGSNCLGEASAGIAELAPYVDHVFGGESEADFLRLLRGEIDQSERIVAGTRFDNLDELPPPDYDDYFEQGQIYVRDWEQIKTRLYLPYETSRGCWWGFKQHCTFCGEYAVPFKYRQKSATTVVQNLDLLSERYGCQRFFIVDSIMPHEYFKTVLPQLAQGARRYEFFYEEKANLSLHKVRTLKRAGVRTIQPGIESFSSDLLVVMKKGVKAYQNIQLLRYAGSVGLELFYWLMWGLPGDKGRWYDDAIERITLMPHLQAPDGLVRMILSRHSPFFNTPQLFGITNMRPSAWYRYVYPSGTRYDKFVNVFEGEFDSEIVADTALQSRLQTAIDAWIDNWRADDDRPADRFFRSYSRRIKSKKTLHIERNKDRYILTDTRALDGHLAEYELTASEVRPLIVAEKYADQPDFQWALQKQMAVVVDDWYVPLTTVSLEVFEEFDADALIEARSNRSQTIMLANVS